MGEILVNADATLTSTDGRGQVEVRLAWVNWKTKFQLSLIEYPIYFCKLEPRIPIQPQVGVVILKGLY